MSKKILVISSYPAPYRVSVFRGLAEVYETEVFFEFIKDQSRSADWFVRDTRFHILCDADARKRFKFCLKHLKEYDLVLAYDYNNRNAMSLMFRCMVRQVPYCINCDGAFIHSHWLKDRIKRLFISRAAACFASGEYAGRYFRHYGAKKERIYYHRFTSLSEEDICKSQASKEEKEHRKKSLGLTQERTVLTIGQFIPRKGIDILLKAWKTLDRTAWLVIVGGGELEEEYMRIVEEEGFQHVILRGFMKKEEIFSYYRASDVFVLPTREDIWGLVINEAMACGLPVVATDRCIAAKELIQNDENGYVVPAENPQALRDALQKVLSDEGLRERMSVNNLKKINGCTIDAIVKKHIEVIDTL